MFPRTECCENREDEKCECHAALPPGESARIPPHQQHPGHMKRGHGIWRTNDLHGFDEQARYIACWNWLPRKLLPQEMYGSKGWKEIVKENADRSGGQQGHKGWHCVFTQAEEPTHIDQSDGDRQSNIEKLARHSQGRPPGKPLPHNKRELQTKAGIEGVEI